MEVLQKSRAWTVISVLLALQLAAIGAQGQDLQPFYRLNFNTPAYVLYSPQVAAASATSRTAANQFCMERGMNIFSAEIPAKDDQFAIQSAAELGTTGYFTYTGSSAEPVGAFTARCVQQQRDISVEPNSGICTFTFRYGLLTIFENSLMDRQPGVAQFFSLYAGLPQAGNAPTGYPVAWDTTRSNPRGYYYMAVTGLTATAGRHVNVDATVAAGDPYVDVSKFVVFCETQDYLGFLPISTRLNQPIFVKGYRELTWAEAHWWVLFVVPAALILALLLFILAYCCATIKTPKEGPPIVPMVLRERNGSLYVNVPAETTEAKHSDFSNMNRNQTPRLVGSHHGPGPMGAPMRAVDPENLIQAVPTLFSREETMMCVDGDSLASAANGDPFHGVEA